MTQGYAPQQRGIERFEQSTFEVVRRYSDFDWLRKRLLMVAPTVAVPPLPPKDGLPVKNFHDEFIESRNRGLQRFVDRIASHPRLRVAGEALLLLPDIAGGRKACSRRGVPKSLCSPPRCSAGGLTGPASSLGPLPHCRAALPRPPARSQSRCSSS